MISYQENKQQSVNSSISLSFNDPHPVSITTAAMQCNHSFKWELTGYCAWCWKGYQRSPWHSAWPLAALIEERRVGYTDFPPKLTVSDCFMIKI